MKILKFTKLESNKNQSDRGFTILEVLIAILVALFFVSTSLQAIVLATMFRVQAQEKQLSYQGIQEDIEAIQAAASSLAANKSLCNATNFADGYADALIDQYQSINSYTGANASLLYTLNQTFLGYTMLLHRDFLGDGRDINGNAGDATDTAESTAPHRILKIRYLTQSIKNGQTQDVTEHYVEIVPNAALQCP